MAFQALRCCLTSITVIARDSFEFDQAPVIVEATGLMCMALR
jgi:hypothetical protein